MSYPLTLTILPYRLAVCRLEPQSELPAWAFSSAFWAITRTEDELSVVCQQHLVPAGVAYQGDWRGLQVAGPLDFGLTGIMARLVAPLADAAIPVFVISTYNTDYVLVKADQLAAAGTALRAAGCTVL